MARGTDWPLFEDGRAPIVVMAPTGEQPDRVWRAWMELYDDIVLKPGWDGTHTPFQAKLSGWYKVLIRRNNEHGKATTGWLFGDNDGDDAGSGLEDWPSRMAFTRELFSFLADEDLSRTVLGIAYDVQEYEDEEEWIERWVELCHELDPRVFVGARAQPRFTYAGDFAAHEDHVKNLGEMPGILDRAIGRSGGRPCWNTERFRVRKPDEGVPQDESKEWVEEDVIGACAILREKNYGAVFGVHRSGNVSDLGSQSWKYAGEIRKALGVEVIPPPPPPPALPRFTDVRHPDYVDWNRTFQIAWNTDNAYRVALSSDIEGPIDHSLPPVGALAQRTKRDSHFTIMAMNDLEQTAQTKFVVRVRGRSWWQQFLDLFR